MRYWFKFEQVATRKINVWKELIYGRKLSWQLPWEVISRKGLYQEDLIIIARLG